MLLADLLLSEKETLQTLEQEIFANNRRNSEVSHFIKCWVDISQIKIFQVLALQ